MTWAEILATFNFVVWFLPILLRSWLAWRFKNVGRDNVSLEELEGLSRSIKGLGIRDKGIKISDSDEKPGPVKK